MGAPIPGNFLSLWPWAAKMSLPRRTFLAPEPDLYQTFQAAVLVVPALTQLDQLVAALQHRGLLVAVAADQQVQRGGCSGPWLARWRARAGDLRRLPALFCTTSSVSRVQAGADRW